MAAPFTIFRARRIHTMNPARPTADAVAVLGDRVLGVGAVEELAAWGDHDLDHRFADKILLPGFVEAHAHAMAGGMWAFPYVGFHDRPDPTGRTWPGCRSIRDVVERLAAADAELEDPTRVLVAWGLDPIFLPGERLGAVHLDQVSTTRPVFVFHASGHLATVNHALLRHEGITEETPTPGVARDDRGELTGELQEPAAMALAASAFAVMMAELGADEAKRGFGQEARNAGHTCITDLGTSRLTEPGAVDAWRRTVEDPDYPARVMVALNGALGGTDAAGAAASAELATRLRHDSTDKLHFGIVKLILDGSIQGFTARLDWPHYFRPPPGHPGNGLWLIPPDQMADLVTEFHRAGLTVHCHCNGDQATEVFVDAVATALERHPRPDHRHTVQHCQLTTPAQYRRMGALGMCANLFTNHLYYWGDQHREITVGPDRAEGMDACATALRHGVALSIHSDAPITPLGHLHTAWCAVNRRTASGRTLGPDESIPVGAALHAITLGAAHQLRLDHVLGSIEVGKYADFAVLDDDPLEVAPHELRDIPVWGTVLGGVPQPAGTDG
ncbi:MAG: amidohydrolase [Acidimicrobiales bacterium]|nr:amidohydrolase [Acidimicrobiales bacterium]